MRASFSRPLLEPRADRTRDAGVGGGARPARVLPVASWLQRTAILAALVALDAGCGRDGDPGRPASGLECRPGLGTYCSRNPCPDYDAAVMELQRFAQTPSCFLAQTGTCGTYRVLVHGGGFGASLRYFDASGRLVAVIEQSDAIDPVCMGTFQYGVRPTCQVRVEHELCGRRQ